MFRTLQVLLAYAKIQKSKKGVSSEKLKNQIALAAAVVLAVTALPMGVFCCEERQHGREAYKGYTE